MPLNQSDYGYTVGPLEKRDRALCLLRAKQSRVFAHQYPHMKETFRRFVREWVKEGKTYAR